MVFLKRIRRREKKRKYWNERQEESRGNLQSHILGTSLLEYVIVLGESAGRPPCCSSDKKLNIWLLSELILSFIAFEILPISPSP